MDAGCAGPAGEGVRVLEGGEVDCGAGWSVLWFKRLEAEGDDSGGRRCGHELCERARLDSALVWWMRPNDRLVGTFTVMAGECPLLSLDSPERYHKCSSKARSMSHVIFEQDAVSLH